MFGLRTKERFAAIMTRLNQVTGTEPLTSTVQLCLRTLRRINASFLLSYFPPQTLTGSTADFRIRWFSRDMYALGENPLWLNPVGNERTYRFTYLPAFAGPTVISLTVPSNDYARIGIKTLDSDRDNFKADRTRQASQDEVGRFVAAVRSGTFLVHAYGIGINWERRRGVDSGKRSGWEIPRCGALESQY